MNWPTSQDYNEAIQNAASSFSDSGLKGGEATLNAIGLPVPRSGNFADVYQFKGGDGKMWAVKCFTRKVAGLQERYAKIDEHLQKAKLPFTVGFKYFEEGIRIRGQWFPLLKMEWVEGFTLNEFVRNNAGTPKYLHALMQMWAKLTTRLRDANFAHADLQHGNVLLVPGDSQGKLGLKLIDYDGMWVPALADTHSGEIGHPNFQHPLRLKDRLYNAEVDRFPHLVIAAALRATLLGGKALWDQFDNGDNLLFKEGDLRDPAKAPIFKTLWNLHDDVLCVLVGKIALASQEPLRRTPWLDDLLLTEEGKRLRDDEEAKVVAMLGVAPHFTAVKAIDAPAPVQNEFNVFAFDDDDTAASPAKASPKKASPAKDDKKSKKNEVAGKAKSKLPLFIGAGVAVAVLLVVGIIVATSGGKKGTPSPQEVAKIEDKTSPREQGKPKNNAIVIPPKKDTPSEAKKSEPGTKKDEPGTKKDEPPPMKDPEVAAKQDPAAGMVAEPQSVWRHSPARVNTNCLIFSNDGSQVLRTMGSLDRKKIFVQSSVDGSITLEYSPSQQGVSTMRMGPDDVIAMTTDGDQLEVVELKTKQVRFTLDGVDKSVPCPVAGQMSAVVVFKLNGDIGVHSLVDGKLISTHNLPQAAQIKSLDCSPDGKTIVAISEAGELYAKIAGEPAFKPVYKSAETGNRRVTLSPGAAHVAVCLGDQPIRILETATGKEHRALSGHVGEVKAALFSNDGRNLLAIAHDKTFRIWDIESSKQLHSITLESPAKELALSPDGQSFAFATDNRTLQLWKVPSGGGTAIVKKDPVVEKKEDPKISTGVAPALLSTPFTKEQADKARAEWAAFLNVPERKQLDLGKGVKLEMVLIPPGDFINVQNKKQRRVTISRPFYLAATETTQQQFEVVTGKNFSDFAPTGGRKDLVAGLDTSAFPADKVSWRNASDYSARIGAQLPSDAQWEYACRAGTITPYYGGETLTPEDANAGKTMNRTAKVASYAPNGFGLYDMHGNVWEHCRDYAGGRPADLPDTDPEQTAKHTHHHMHGGAWNSGVGECRSFHVSEVNLDDAFNYFGCRVMMPVADDKVVVAPKMSEDVKPKDTPPKIEPKGVARALLKAPFTKEQAEKARAEWAAFRKIPERKLLDLGKGVKLELVLIPPGRFRMGTPGDTANEIAHDVTISKPFYMAATPTTQEQYEAVMGNNPSGFSPAGKKKDAVNGLDTAQFPVEMVSWNDSVRFCEKVGGSLPTEAEWEYACRAGTTTAFSFGDMNNGTDATCQGSRPFGTDMKGPNARRTDTVNRHPANAFGLYEMHGNVWQWCRDFYDIKLEDLPEKDPERTTKRSTDMRTTRGGSWFGDAAGCRSAARLPRRPGTTENNIGFRICVRLN